MGHIINSPYNISNGYVVVGMDQLKDPAQKLTPSNLSPAIGASALLEGMESAEPFTFTPQLTQPGNTVEKHGSSWVTWPDVQPGSGVVEVEDPQGAGKRCGVSPGFLDSLGMKMAVAVYPDSISVVSYICTDLS